MKGDAGTTDVEWLQSIFEEVLADVAGDVDVWLNEMQRRVPRRIIWPLPAPTNASEATARAMGLDAVERILEAIRQADGASAARDVGENDQKFQAVLRVAKLVVDRTLERGAKEIGPGRVHGKRELKKRARELTAAAVVPFNKRAGRAVVEKSGMSKSAFYRARQRWLERR